MSAIYIDEKLFQDRRKGEQRPPSDKLKEKGKENITILLSSIRYFQ